MRSWLAALAGEVGLLFRFLLVKTASMRPARSHPDRHALLYGLLLASFTLGAGLLLSSVVGTGNEWATASGFDPAGSDPEDLSRPVRDEPARFLANVYLPRRPERTVCGSPTAGWFVPERDLVRVDDPRVWWESDHDVNDDEDDHLVHHVLAPRLRRLIELTALCGGTLKVQDSYRPSGIHNNRSLHKEGRAVDLTCDELGLEKLAKLCWAAGFDWVYHEAPKSGGAHVHASVRDPNHP